MFKRLLPVAGVLGAMSIALAGSAAAGGGGGYGGPGKFTFTDTNAYASLSDSTGAYSSVFVDRGYQSFKQKRTPGAPVVEVYGTVLNVNESMPDGSFSFGCWLIPASAFTVASNLSSATLSVNATSDMQCPGFYVGGATGGKPGLQSSIGFGGGGGGGGPAILTAINANVSWSGTGAVWSQTNNGSSHCQNYNETNQASIDYDFATATSSSGDLAGQSDPFAQLSASTQTANSNTIPSAACNPFGF